MTKILMDKVERLEGKLAIAVEALEWYADHSIPDSSKASKVLKLIKDDKQESTTTSIDGTIEDGKVTPDTPDEVDWEYLKRMAMADTTDRGWSRMSKAILALKGETKHLYQLYDSVHKWCCNRSEAIKSIADLKKRVVAQGERHMKTIKILGRTRQRVAELEEWREGARVHLDSLQKDSDDLYAEKGKLEERVKEVRDILKYHRLYEHNPTPPESECCRVCDGTGRIGELLLDVCEACDGTGGYVIKPKDCPEHGKKEPECTCDDVCGLCGGTGEVPDSALTVVCPQCDGKSDPDPDCPKCNPKPDDTQDVPQPGDLVRAYDHGEGGEWECHGLVIYLKSEKAGIEMSTQYLDTQGGYWPKIELVRPSKIVGWQTMVDAMRKAVKHLMEDIAPELKISYAMEHLDDALDDIPSRVQIKREEG